MNIVMTQKSLNGKICTFFILADYLKIEKSSPTDIIGSSSE